LTGLGTLLALQFTNFSERSAVNFYLLVVFSNFVNDFFVGTTLVIDSQARPHYQHTQHSDKHKAEDGQINQAEDADELSWDYFFKESDHEYSEKVDETIFTHSLAGIITAVPEGFKGADESGVVTAAAPNTILKRKTPPNRAIR